MHAVIWQSILYHFTAHDVDFSTVGTEYRTSCPMAAELNLWSVGLARGMVATQSARNYINRHAHFWDLTSWLEAESTGGVDSC